MFDENKDDTKVIEDLSTEAKKCDIYQEIHLKKIECELFGMQHVW